MWGGTGELSSIRIVSIFNGNDPATEKLQPNNYDWLNGKNHLSVTDGESPHTCWTNESKW